MFFAGIRNNTVHNVCGYTAFQRIIKGKFLMNLVYFLSCLLYLTYSIVRITENTK